MITWKRRSVGTALACLVAAALSGCAEKIDPAVEEARLMETSRQWSRAAQGKNLDRVLAYYAPDATLIQSSRPIAKGHEQIRGHLAFMKGRPDFRISWRPREAQSRRRATWAM